MKKNCDLCQSNIREKGIVDIDNYFCCHGCHSVYHILAAKKELDNFQSHPIFNQAIKSGLISNPDILAQISLREKNEPPKKLKKIHLEIEGMWCPSCAEVIYLILMREKGVLKAVVDYATDFAIIEFYPQNISEEHLFKLISSIGYKPHRLENTETKKYSRELYLRFIVAAFCSFNVMMFSYPLYASYFDYDPMQYGNLFAWLSFYMSLPVVTFSFWPILQKFINALKFGIYGMEALIVMGVTSSFVLSFYEIMTGGTRVYFDSMTVIITFVLLGKLIETKAKFSAKDSLLRLNFAIPRRVRKQLTDGSLQFVPIKEIKKNDVFAVFQGEKIPLDGVVLQGEGNTDDSLMTGESLPLFKLIGSQVIGGSILENGRLWIKADTENQQSALKSIIEMIELGLKTKTSYRRGAESLIGWFVPIVLGLSLCTFIGFWFFANSEIAFINALSVVLISCPCAIGIATPLAEFYLMRGLSEIGAIVRNRRVVSSLGKETVYVFDKTGTVTEGKFTVLKGLEDLKIQDLAFMKEMTGQSQHLISAAIFKSIGVDGMKIDSLKEIAGGGLIGIRGSDIFHIGSQKFLILEGVSLSNEELHLTEFKNLHSKVYVAKNFKRITTLWLGDNIRDGAKELVAKLKPGLTILLSGDSESVVSFVAKELNVDRYYAGCSPLQKRQIIEDLKSNGHIVCMMGDGINDAPAMTTADVGISVVTATDVTIQVSDILFTTTNLLNFLKVQSLAHFGRVILKQNLFWAFFYNVVGLILAVCGLLSPIFATFAMMASSLIVLYNAKRLLYRVKV
jgi:Cu2+-exporting ATPase